MIYLSILLIPLFSVLNRLRGTGKLINKEYKTTIFNKEIVLKFNGNILFALFMGIYFSIYTSQWWAFFVGAITYALGEAPAWGKWVGTLAYPERDDINEKDYNNKVGTSYPFIHYIANFFIDQTKDFYAYCWLALAIRGFYWWVLPLVSLSLISDFSIYLALIYSVALGIAFPLACEIGKDADTEFKFWKFEMGKGWENQEVIYGIFQGLIFALILI